MSRMRYLSLRESVIKIARQMAGEGLTQGASGNVSVRNEEGFLISASGIAYKRMKPEHVVQMDLEGNYSGDHLPSTEWRMHLDIYKAKPEAQAVIHVHSPYATSLACLRREIPAFHYMIAVTGGTSLRVADYAGFGTQELSANVIAALEERSACLLANHGQICFAASLERALWLAGEVESLCHHYWAASLLGKPVTLSEQQMAYVIDRFRSYGKARGEIAPDSAALEFFPKHKAGDIKLPKKPKKPKKKKS